MAKLTEQDILNWDGPEEDYMNSDQLAFFRELLVKMQDELIENASATTGHLQEHESAPDPADRATQEEEYALELRTRDRERKLLGKYKQPSAASTKASTASAQIPASPLVSNASLPARLLHFP